MRRAAPFSKYAIEMDSVTPPVSEGPEATFADRSAPPARDVLERVRARDPGALGVVFDRYFDRVYGLAFRLLGNHHAAEDATQEVFLKLHRAAHRIDPARDPGPWITRITLNACRDAWRSRAGRMDRRSVSLDADPAMADTLASPSAGPEQHFEDSRTARTVQSALCQLPEPLRVAVVLRDYEGLTHEEIAAVTGSTHVAVRKRYSRALRSLARLLQGTPS
jgi:RNA polymerase sigma-70 factor (ECF subfamily)